MGQSFKLLAESLSGYDNVEIDEITEGSKTPTLSSSGGVTLDMDTAFDGITA